MKMDGFAKKEPLEQTYEIGDDIGSGHFAVVRRVTHKTTKHEYAAKFIRKRRGGGRRGAKMEDIQREVSILRSLDHSNVISLYEVHDTGPEVVLILELVTGGELFDYISEKDHLGEEEASAFIAQILHGLKHLHDRNIAHLDLKPENIMLLNKNSQNIKLIDFGLAQNIKETEDIRALMGTAEFIAPEVVSYETLSLATDMWSIGVITYILLSGASPFLGDSQQETYHNITAVNYAFDDEYFSNTTELAKDFIRKLFVKNPRKRATVNDCLNHAWIRPKEKREEIARKSAVINIDNFKAFMARKRWKQSMRVVSLCNRLSRSMLLRKSTDTLGSRNTLDEEKSRQLLGIKEDKETPSKEGTLAGASSQPGEKQASSSDLNCSEHSTAHTTNTSTLDAGTEKLDARSEDNTAYTTNTSTLDAGTEKLDARSEDNTAHTTNTSTLDAGTEKLDARSEDNTAHTTNTNPLDASNDHVNDLTSELSASVSQCENVSKENNSQCDTTDLVESLEKGESGNEADVGLKVDAAVDDVSPPNLTQDEVEMTNGAEITMQKVTALQEAHSTTATEEKQKFTDLCHQKMESPSQDLSEEETANFSNTIPCHEETNEPVMTSPEWKEKSEVGEMVQHCGINKEEILQDAELVPPNISEEKEKGISNDTPFDEKTIEPSAKSEQPDGMNRVQVHEMVQHCDSDNEQRTQQTMPPPQAMSKEKEACIANETLSYEKTIKPLTTSQQPEEVDEAGAGEVITHCGVDGEDKASFLQNEELEESENVPMPDVMKLITEWETLAQNKGNKTDKAFNACTPQIFDNNWSLIKDAGAGEAYTSKAHTLHAVVNNHEIAKESS